MQKLPYSRTQVVEFVDRILQETKAGGEAALRARLVADLQPLLCPPDDMIESSYAKLSDILHAKHSPLQHGTDKLMAMLMDTFRTMIGPRYLCTLFVSEAPSRALGRDALFNYASECKREDMLAVLEAFVVKHRAAGPVLDKIADDPPTPTAQ